MTTNMDPLHIRATGVMETAAEALLRLSPTCSARARHNSWLDVDGNIDWDVLQTQSKRRSGAWTGAERRLIHAVSTLSDLDLAGVDSDDVAALISALTLAVDAARKQLGRVRAGEALLARGLSG